jgi:hypothetical protein
MPLYSSRGGMNRRHDRFLGRIHVDDSAGLNSPAGLVAYAGDLDALIAIQSADETADLAGSYIERCYQIASRHLGPPFFSCLAITT